MTAVVFVIVLVTKFLAGAWIAILAMIIFFIDHARHPAATTTTSRTSWPPTRRTRSCPPGCTRSSWSPSCTSRRCGRSPSPRRPGPTCSRRVYVVDQPARRPTGCCEEWDQRRIDVPLKVLHSPYRELIRPIVEYATEIRRGQPARRGRGLHPGVRRRAAGGSSSCTTRPRCGSRAGCCSPPASWSPRCPTSCAPPRSPASASCARSYRVRPGDLRRGEVDGAPTARSEPVTRAAEPDAAPAPARPRARRASGSGSTSWSVRSRTAGTSSPGCRRGGPGGLRPARAARGAGRRRGHRGHRRRPVLARPTPSRCSTPSPDRVDGTVPVRRPGRLRRLRLPARDAGRAARAQGRRGPPSSCAGWPGSSVDVVVEAVPGDERRAALAHPACVRPAARRAAGRCASTARTRSSPVDDCLIARPARERRRPTYGRAGRRAFDGRATTASGRCTPARRRCWSTPCWTSSPRSRGSRCSTCTPASGCSRAFLADAVGAGPGRRASRATAARLRARRGQPARARTVLRGDVGRGARRGCRRAGRPRRPRPAARGRPPRGGRGRSSPARRAPSPTSPATRPPWPATSRSSPSTATGSPTLRAFDLFPMTHHVECVALLDRCPDHESARLVVRAWRHVECRCRWSQPSLGG